MERGPIPSNEANDTCSEQKTPETAENPTDNFEEGVALRRRDEVLPVCRRAARHLRAIQTRLR